MAMQQWRMHGETRHCGSPTPPPFSKLRFVSHLNKELGDQRVPQTLGPTQTCERHTKREKGLPRERRNKSSPRAKGGCE